MAKKIISNSPTKDVVFVNSRTYGKHTRAARGSKTPATVNDVLATQAANTSIVNAAAKTVYDVLKLYSEGFREGQLWQALLSYMRKAKSMHFKDLLHALGGLELNSRYPLKRFGNIPVFSVENGKKIWRIEMKPFMPPRLNKKDDCYQYTVIVLLFNNKGICVQHAKQTTAWTDKKEKINNQVFHFNKPKAANYYLLCLQLQGGIDGVATNTLASSGIAICTPWE